MFADDDIREFYLVETAPREPVLSVYDSPFQYNERRGRKKKYTSNAEKQKAYRERKRDKSVTK